MSVARLLRMPALPPILLGLAFWPVWEWYLVRITGPWDEPWGLMALLAAVVFLFRQKPLENQRPVLLPAAILLLLYIIAYPLLHPLLRAAIAVMAIGITIASWRLGRVFHLGLWGLLLLSLPLLHMLQFVLGYPLRTITAVLSSLLLRMNGFAVRPHGACLDWNGTLVWVDAPCSGVKMLWTGLFLSMALACFRGLNTARTIMAALLTIVATIAANAIRTAALFFIEAKVIDAPEWAHEWAGLVVFAATAYLIFWTTIRLRGADSCEPSLYS